MTKFLSLCLFIALSTHASGVTFKEAVKTIKNHNSILLIDSSSQALRSQGRAKGSWGDLKLKIAATNFPKETMKDDETPMTGIEFGISQKISLTTKFGHIKDGFYAQGKAKKYEAQNQGDSLLKKLWKLIIDSKRISHELKILEENLEWTSRNVKVSKKLYSNGKISQQALLEIQIRKSEIEAQISNKRFEMKEHDAHHSYLFGEHAHIDERSIPWNVLINNKVDIPKIDLKELSLKSQLEARDSFLTSKNLNYVPDLTFSIGYTKRSDIDDKGDFVSASVSFPIPTSSRKYAEKAAAVHNKNAAKYKLANYISFKENELKRVSYIKEKVSAELSLLRNKTIKFADNSRRVTSKSYGLGQASYLELLQSELKLQQLLLKEARLDSKYLNTILELKYISGEKLHE
jgi:hypothetical protein